jgi:hypothetical protein
VSELLDRVRREIRERLEATRAAVFEYERLEAALHALGDAGSRATRAVRGDDRGSRAAEAAPRSRAAAKPSKSTRKQRPSTAKSGARASARDEPGAAAGGLAPSAAAQKPTAARRGAPKPRSARAKVGSPARAGAATPVRERVPRGANRDAALRVVGERPGVTARELAAASRVTAARFTRCCAD